MKQICLLLCLSIFYTTASIAQNKIEPTNAFKIGGMVKKEVTYTLADLEKFADEPIPDVALQNHLGEQKGVLREMRGIPFKELMEQVEFTTENPKQLSELFFVLVASDNYKVTFSWNEIYNTTVGDHLYIVTSIEGKKLSELDQRIAFISTSDLKSGRRYVKGLKEVWVRIG